MIASENGNGAPGRLCQSQKKALLPPEPASPGVKQTQIIFQTLDGVELHGALARMTRFAVVFELYNPSVIPRLSEVLDTFKIIFQERVIYSGRAGVRNVVDAGAKIVCEATLDESSWAGLNSDLLAEPGGDIKKEFKAFISEWQNQYRLLPEFKVVVADMQMFFHDLRLWLEQVELGIQSFQPPLHEQLENDALKKLTCPVVQAIDTLIDRFESVVVGLENEQHPAHQIHLRRQLHPLVLRSSFAHRAFSKPLGYAGDYQVVDMMIRSPLEGHNLFSKIVNIWLLGQTPAQAHRNRVDYLEGRLIKETVRVMSVGRTLRVFNLGCGPAAEVQRFFNNQKVSKAADFTLVDFNQETLNFLRQKLDGIRFSQNGSATYRMVKKSVNQILKEGRSAARQKGREQYDYIYCAGLFDYLSDDVCKQLMNIFYDMLAPGGLLLATNATDALNVSRPFRYSMEYILDWYLIYRDTAQFTAVAPDLADKDHVFISAEATGANLFLEIRKPENA